MADEQQEQPVVLDLEPAAPEGAEPKPRYRRRPQIIPADQAEQVVADALAQIGGWQDERAEWIEKRLQRYQKLRGWLESSSGFVPWSNASNQHIPIMLANKLRMDAGLYNAVLGQRPVMKAQTVRGDHRKAAESEENLLDHQMFTENEGEKEIEKYIDQFTGDGTVFSYQPWVKQRGVIYDSRVISAPMGADGEYGMVDAALLDSLVKEQIGDQGFMRLVQHDDEGYEWTGHYRDDEGVERTCEICVYAGPEDEQIEVCFEWDGLIFDGPTMIVQDLEDVVAPMRSENLQPITDANPNGSPGVATFHRVHIDSLKRGKVDGIYDLLSAEDIEELEGTAGARTEGMQGHENEAALKEQRDTQTGLAPQHQDEDRKWFTLVKFYTQRDVRGNGLVDDVILWILLEPKKLARAKYLTELYPGLPPRRPLSEARFIPVSGQLYGMGLPELMEGLHDLLHELVNQNIDSGWLSSIPFFGYRASSGMKAEGLRLEPGVGFPLDNPQQDLAFYNLPTRDQGWSFNMIGLAMQFLERLVQISPIQFGQVPQGKASALRTTGSMMALLQQGSAMPEQVLRRLFRGLKQVYGQFHMLNTRFLPPKKRFLVTGKPLNSEEAYGVIDDRKDISIPIAFSFEATLLNTNKGAVATALQGIGAALFNPLAMQMGTVDSETYYNWAVDFVKAADLDANRYIKRPPGVTDAPKILAQEAILAITEGRLPTDTHPLEPAQDHMAALIDFMNSDQFGLLLGGKELLFREYIQHVQKIVAAEQQAQQMQQAAAQFSQAMGGGAEGKPGAPTQNAPDTSMQPEMGSADELAGAMQG